MTTPPSHLMIGDVTYNVTGFLDKNKDTLFIDLSNAMMTSKNNLILELFPPPDLNSKKRPVTAATQFKVGVNFYITNPLLDCSASVDG